MKIQIDTMEQCNKALGELKHKGYKLWQMQFDTDSEFGFHAWFWKEGVDDVEVRTFNREVKDAIIAHK
ncbi:MAG TPA: hypothetical protein VD757_02640 [Candidatus Nitrosocosmicus sp.]|nr:hypothetical protein [Candidatus Nitrosocosmicus sp.]